MSKTSIIHARIEPSTKSSAESVLSRLGITPTEAIRIFYTQISLYHGLPFPLAIPNKLTRKTLSESRRGKNVQRFDSVESLFKTWKA